MLAQHTTAGLDAHLESGPPRTGASPAESSLLLEGTGFEGAQTPSTAAAFELHTSLPFATPGCLACGALLSSALSAAPVGTVPCAAPGAPDRLGAAGAIHRPSPGT